eukprot:TRINITY_DN7890_c0_g1_i1.p1 TRINITY_DN7890_c0_g1~~TRINITY_DN7890_c0_g1_i1.p1  ORF type:complete len:711 (-),score=196.56 TRINITY_DN7890_c0_g1_i1:1666-3798(-)
MSVEEICKAFEGASLLRQAQEAISAHWMRGSSAKPFGEADPNVVRNWSVWYTSYPPAVVSDKPKVLTALCEDTLWKSFKEIGVKAIHMGPVKKAGSVSLGGSEVFTTEDGLFDRISLKIDESMGTDEDYRNLVRVASENGSVVIGDIIPSHVGRGPDFMLALRNVHPYRRMFVLHELPAAFWEHPLIPDVPSGRISRSLSQEAADILHKEGIVPGDVKRVLFSDPSAGVRLSGWDVTGVIEGMDGIRRRWVYMHYFKPNQPSLDWTSPTCEADIVQNGDILKTVFDFGAHGIRLDANPFTSFEYSGIPTPVDVDGSTVSRPLMHSEGHPLSLLISKRLAMTIRRNAAFSFQELNIDYQSLKMFSEYGGADLSYDFVTRPAYHHAVLSGNAEFLNICIDLIDTLEIHRERLIHALQNHDEITYELVHFMGNADRYVYHGKELSGDELRTLVRSEMESLRRGSSLSGNGLCTTSAGLCALRLGIESPTTLEKVLPHRAAILKSHLLMVYFNAMQPGVFAFSGWDAVGALPFGVGGPVDHITRLDGDWRFHNRGAVDLTGKYDEHSESIRGFPRAPELYGGVPKQLEEPSSFMYQVKTLLKVRERYGIHVSRPIPHAPRAKHPSVCILLHALDPSNMDHPSNHRLSPPVMQMTAINFSRTENADETLTLPPAAGMVVWDLIKDVEIGRVSEEGDFLLSIPAEEGLIVAFSPSS